MEASIFKFAFFILMGLALVGLLTMATVAIVFWLKVTWLWLRPHKTATNARQQGGTPITWHLGR